MASRVLLRAEFLLLLHWALERVAEMDETEYNLSCLPVFWVTVSTTPV